MKIKFELDISEQLFDEISGTIDNHNLVKLPFDLQNKSFLLISYMKNIPYEPNVVTGEMEFKLIE